MIWNLIVAFGDSLTSGARDNTRRGYPMELEDMLTLNYPEQFFVVANEGIVRETSNDLRKRAYNTLRKYPDASLVLLMIGTNDAKEGIPLNTYSVNLLYLITLCELLSKKVIVATLPSIQGMGLYNYSTENQKFIDEYNQRIVDLHKNLPVQIADMRKLNTHRVDKVHFGNDGYKEMAKIWMEAIEKL